MDARVGDGHRVPSSMGPAPAVGLRRVRTRQQPRHRPPTCVESSQGTSVSADAWRQDLQPMRRPCGGGEIPAAAAAPSVSRRGQGEERPQRAQHLGGRLVQVDVQVGEGLQASSFHITVTVTTVEALDLEVREPLQPQQHPRHQTAGLEAVAQTQVGEAGVAAPVGERTQDDVDVVHVLHVRRVQGQVEVREGGQLEEWVRVFGLGWRPSR